MKIYVAGKVTGTPDFKERFAVTTARLRARGHEVINPVELYSGDGPPVPHGSREYEAIMERCFQDLLSCDAICTLTGWQNSPGAVREVDLAKTKGIPALTEDYFLPAKNLYWIGDDECEPVRGYEGDAGLDLTVSESTLVPYDGFVDVPLGISVQLPKGTWAMLVGRSSTIRRRRLLVTQSIIDNGYRGPLFAAVQNVGPTAVSLDRGERIAQLIILPLFVPEDIVKAKSLGPSDRGENGFGSSGA